MLLELLLLLLLPLLLELQALLLLLLMMMIVRGGGGGGGGRSTLEFRRANPMLDTRGPQVRWPLFGCAYAPTRVPPGRIYAQPHIYMLC